MGIEIRIETLSDGAKSGQLQLEESLWVEDLGDIYGPAEEPLQLTWELSSVGTLIAFSGRVTGELRYRCARCTEGLALAVDIPMEHHWVGQGQLSADGGDELDGFDRDPDVSEHDGETVDLEPVVRECLVVEAPFAPSCDVSVSGPCPDWTEEAPVLHPGGAAPDVEPDHPFAALASFNLSEPREP